MSWLSDLLFGRKSEDQEVSTLSPEQQEFLKMLMQTGGLEGNPLYGAGSDYLQQLLSNEPGAYSQFEAPLMSQFHQQIVPQIANTFAGAGTGAGAVGSSAFGQQLGQAGAGLQKDIGALRGMLQQNALGQALQYAQQPIANRLAGLQTPTKAFRRTQGQPGLIPQGLAAYFGSGGGFGGFGGGIGNLLGGFGRQAYGGFGR